MTTNGTIALVGSGEYLPPIQPLDKKLLEHVQGTPQVVVLPTAAAPDGMGVLERWARMGVEHFGLLGAVVESVMLVTREDAERQDLAEQIAQANFVYFSGGKPRYLLETLQGTLAWEAVLQVYRGGGVIAGCSAGAMVMGGAIFDFPQMWRMLPALALAPGLAVIPHFDELPIAMLSMLNHNNGKTITVGVDGSTALVGREGRWTVYGRGGVTVFEGKKKVRYTEGEEVSLPHEQSQS
jgi:cyanophycinase